MAVHRDGSTMAGVKIVTDTGADLPRELLAKHSIAVVSLRVNFGQESYLDGKELSSAELYEKLVTCKETASTTQPNPQDFAKVYEELTADGSKIVSIHLSGGLSGTQQSATIAASMFPEGVIQVIDSRQASMGLGLLVLYAAELAERGAEQAEIVEAVKTMSSQVSTYFMVDTLEYLQRNGRIGKAQAVVGSLLQIKPVLTIDDGLVAAKEKVRGKTKAERRLLEIMREDMGDRKIWAALVHGNVPDEAERIAAKIRADFNCTRVVISLIGGTIGVHAGPGTIGFMAVPAPE